MRRSAIVASLALALAGAALACGQKRLPAPDFVGQPTSALVQVPYPPPPARVEYVPPQPNEDAVWIDGEWVWRGRRYAWTPGRWVTPPANASFAPWQTVRDTAGTLYIAQGAWRDPAGNEVAPPKPLAVGKPGPGSVTSAEGDEVTAPGLAPDAASNSPATAAGDAGASAEDVRQEAGPTDAGATDGGAGDVDDGGDASGAGDAARGAARVEKP